MKIKVYNVLDNETILKKIWWFLIGATKVQGIVIKEMFKEAKFNNLEDNKIYYLKIN